MLGAFDSTDGADFNTFIYATKNFSDSVLVCHTLNRTLAQQHGIQMPGLAVINMVRCCIDVLYVLIDGMCRVSRLY